MASFRYPSKFQRVSRLAFVTAAVQRRRSLEANQTLHNVWPSPGLLHDIYIFEGSCCLTEFCLVQNSLYIKVLRSLILAALLHGTPAAGVSQTLQRGTRNGITELSLSAPPIFGRAAMTLGGPHSSYVYFQIHYGHFVFLLNFTFDLTTVLIHFFVGRLGVVSRVRVQH